MNINSKTNKIVGYMRTHKGITQMDAYELCKATRLGAIIFDLKKKGFDIETAYMPNESGYGKYAIYSLTPDYKEYLKYVAKCNKANEDVKSFKEWSR